MRTVDAEAGDRVLDSVRSVLRESSFLFRRDDWARVISGEEEGAYDWLVANYLTNDGAMPSHDEACGAMDLGGASVQVSYLASSSREKMRSSTSKELAYPLRIDDLEYPVFTRSLLHYGVDRGRVRYDEGLSLGDSNPCYPVGYDDPVSNIAGSSDWEACLRGVEKILFNQTARNNCGVRGRRDCGGDLPVDFDRKFIAMSAFVYIWDYLGLKTGNETDDLIALDANARRVCSLNQTQQLHMYERHMRDNSIFDRRTTKPHAQCFNAAFSYHLLSKSFGLPLANTPIEVYHHIGGTKVQWALGMMLVEANKLGSMTSESRGGSILHKEARDDDEQTHTKNVGNAMSDKLSTSALFLPCLSPMRPMMSPPNGRMTKAPPYNAKLAIRREEPPSLLS
ncbi:hypothetical protein ACHAW5_010125 [Stephanodiscus triporus]|uniref:Nucleoside phosphatase GDA1/CD39 n=1 Tax=Stephanodiscus triporus TaxID=2934178 RepID=A0ABD3MWW0_9STRA